MPTIEFASTNEEPISLSSSVSFGWNCIVEECVRYNPAAESRRAFIFVSIIGGNRREKHLTIKGNQVCIGKRVPIRTRQRYIIWVNHANARLTQNGSCIEVSGKPTISNRR